MLSANHRLLRRIVLIVVLSLSIAIVVEGQDLTIEDLDRLGNEALRSGNYLEAEHYFRLAVDRLGSSADSAAAKLAVAIADVAEMLRSRGRYDEAAPQFERALQILRTAKTPDNRDMAVILNNQGRLYQQTGRYALSESCLKQALRLTEREFGARHPQMVRVLNSLGLLYASIRKWDDAKAAYKQALVLAKPSRLENPTYSSVLGNLAVVYGLQQQWSRAEPLHLEALQLAQVLYGAEHPETMIILSNLGFTYYGEGKLDEAERAFRRAFDVQRERVGPEDLFLAGPAFGLGLVLTAKGDYDGAKSMFDTSLRIQERNPADVESTIPMTLEAFAKLLRIMKDSEKASVMEARARLIRAQATYTVKVQPK